MVEPVEPNTYIMYRKNIFVIDVKFLFETALLFLDSFFSKKFRK